MWKKKACPTMEDILFFWDLVTGRWEEFLCCISEDSSNSISSGQQCFHSIVLVVVLSWAEPCHAMQRKSGICDLNSIFHFGCKTSAGKADLSGQNATGIFQFMWPQRLTRSAFKCSYKTSFLSMKGKISPEWFFWRSNQCNLIWSHWAAVKSRLTSHV